MGEIRKKEVFKSFRMTKRLSEEIEDFATNKKINKSSAITFLLNYALDDIVLQEGVSVVINRLNEGKRNK
jgi:hypothetical protein